MKASPISAAGFKKIFSQIGSPTFLEPMSLMVLVVPLMFVASVTTAEITESGDWIAWLLANALALTALAVIILSFRALWLKKFPNVVFTLPVAAIIAASIGSLKALLTAQTAALFSDNGLPDLNLEARLWGGALSGLVALISASAVMLLLQEFQAERMLLLTAKTMASAPLVTSTESRKLSQLSKGLEDILKKVKQHHGFAPSMEASLLRELVDKYVRPLSSSLFSLQEKNYQSFAAKELLRSALRTSPPALALAINFLISTPRNVDWLGPSSGIILTILVSVTIYFSARLLSKLASLLSIVGPLSFLAISTSTTVGSVLLWLNVLEPSKQIEPLIIFTLIVWSTQSGIVFGMAKVALTNASENRTEVSALVQIRDPDVALAMLQRNRKLMANQMHGEVQSRLMNLVLTSESGAVLESKVVIAELEAIRNLIRNVKREPISLEDSLDRLVATWSGFAKLELCLDGMEISREKEDLMFALIEEGVSNAIRHGMADRIKVTIEDGNRLVISDNGMGPKSGSAGLGSKLFDVSSEFWSLSPMDDGGSKLSLEIRI